ncbi:hypothetical protein PUNSTDRAFT_113481 [Punctularia strigosozonata HHB-11173 SS5]|uniref:uncharacterized protein n=1 Tax=Punctularia strigosozonata (strain HHB-11173) TaxID=741275 RepID=UPI00044170F1|nr:uncharacterized protein PUNSTDRAFT_113481 [Punctularia strigosozonata HHB-11173 SS5]EIN08853.1 hypothetical protein PUNSTDRAFT_113481 [Punctularia strigosozonata HHB-11173 SS5]
MAVPDPTAVKVYTVNGQTAGSSSSLPDWLTRKRAAKGKGKKARREHIEGTIELIQGFEFPEASNRIKTTRDGHHAIATGTYKPRMKVWDLDQLTLKFERHTDAENVDFICLSDDWTKSLHLQNDRTLELHTQGGFHYRTRIPRFGRALAYHFPSCDAYVAASGSEVYRLNLEQGRFMNPINLQGDGGEVVPGVNTIDINPAHQLLAFGTETNATVEFWDPRSRARVGVLRLPRQRLGGSRSTVLPGLDDVADADGISVTALSSRSDGLSYAIGTSTGHTLLYDIRSALPFALKDQGYGLPIKRLSWIEGGSRMAGDGLVLSADTKVIKIWDRNTPSTNFTSITPATDLNDVHHVPGSGLLLCANEGIQMNTFFIPQLGPAPRWCSFLENITEEMEDQTTRTAYEDYKFVERRELTSLGLDHLIGTPALKPYMHGYFLSLKLYDTARVIANPFAYEEHREKQIKEKMDKLADTRIRTRKDVSVKVNKALAERVKREEERERKRREKKLERLKAKAAAAEGADEPMVIDQDEPAPESGKQTLLNDPRFTALFEDPEFQVDETTREFALMNPSMAAHRQTEASSGSAASRRMKTAVEEEEEESDRSSSDGLGESDDEDARSDDSSDAGDLGFDDPRTKLPVPEEQVPHSARRKPNVQFVPLRAQADSGARTDRNAAFGQRRSGGGSGQSAAKPKGRSSSHGGGGSGNVEMTWVPSASAARDQGISEKAGKGKGRTKSVERFGAGLERGGEEERRRDQMSESERKGRTQRRKGIRSGSKNAIFGRT